jgi:hypothetical protein
MRRSLSRHVLTLAVLGLVASACGSSTSTPTTPTTPDTVTETFSGTLNQNGAMTFPFAAQSSGTVSAVLTKVEPDATIAVGLALGTWNGSACQIVLANDSALQSVAVTGEASTAGTLCVRIYDVGKVTDPITFEVQVLHP